MKEVKQPKKPLIFYYLIVLAVIMLLNIIVVPWFTERSIEDVDYGTFISMTEDKKIDEVDIETQSNVIYFTGKDDKKVYKTAMVSDENLTERLYKSGAKFSGQEIKQTSPILSFILSWIVPILIFTLLGRMLANQMMKHAGGGKNSMMFGMGKSNAKIYVNSTEGIKFTDVAGEDEAKENLAEIVEYLHNPGKYKEIGASMPKGILLVGPPGTGKTMLAKAVAGEANVPFFSMSGSEFVEMFVGMGASKVRDLFQQAKEKAPCIVFIDEIDAIGKKRDGQIGGNDEREQTLNQLLTEMDGFEGNNGVIILAATNRPDSLDPALLRPGRFDRRVIVEKPDLQGRIDTLKVHSRNVKMDETVDLRELALATAGAVGADLANIINEAALTAVRSGRSMVSQADLIGAVELVFAGKEKKGKLLGDQEKKVVAYHEVGHALLVALQKHTEPVQRITIVPRTMGSLGYVWQVPEEEKYMETKAELEANIVTTLGGRAAEELKFESVTTGAANDIEQATKTVRAMITMYGMSDKFGLMQLETVQGKYLDRNAVLQCSDKTAAKVDEEIRNQLKKAYDEAKKLLSEHMNALDAIAQYLIEKESITGQEFMEIFNRVENAEQNVEQE